MTHWRRAALAGVLLGALALASLELWVRTAVLPPLHPEVSTVVEARDGRLLRAFTVDDGRWRLPVEPAEVASIYLDQLIAFEDKRFRRHRGVDVLALARATGQAVWHGRVVSGGSTLTMQVARLLEASGTGRWSGKLRQMRVALALERRATKDEILSLYLRLAPFGGNIEGVRAASLVYFRKEPGRLTPAEAALLVALPQSPEGRRPDRRPDAARAARDRVLARGVRAGVLTAGDARAARAEPVPRRRHAFAALAPHLAEQTVAERPLAVRHRLTLDRDAQAKAEALVAARVLGRHRALSAAVIVVDNRTGAVRVSVGSPAYLDARRAGFVDMTRALRSPGSTLKPLIYGLAFEAGAAHPETIIDDAPTRYDSYAPQNFDGQFLGQLRLREALQLSRNIPAVTLLEDVGPAVLMARLARAGARAELQGTPGLAVALGGLGINLRDLTATYAALARGGRSVALVTRAADERNAPGGRPVLTPLAAWYVGDILAGVAPPPGAPAGVAYKTGTSYGHRDAWAVGFDGHHTVGVWLGRADGAAMPGTLGANLAAPLLFDVFSALGPVEPLIPPPPEALIVSNAELPRPLRVFRRAGAGEGPRIAFPPDGARVFLMAEPLAARVDQGVPPFTWLANGVPLRIALRDRQAELGAVAPGPLTLSVIDATGASSQVRLTVE